MGQSPSQPSSSPSPTTASTLPPNHPPTTSSDPSSSACPVDHKSREAWMKAAQQQKSASDSIAPSDAIPVRPRLTNSRLSTHREVSSIPRGFPQATAPSPSSQAGPPSQPSAAEAASHGTAYAVAASANNQTSDPHTSPDGTWIYPSEEMFFNAMKRKSYSPRERDMSSVIPIHNAVNERTWQSILRWERPYASAAVCPGGPKLVSFQGDSSKVSPRARFYGILGYERPFDRHDWVVDRCGTKVEYLIDFYQGKNKAGVQNMGPSFYLDVRPKLNSWEGIRMRMLRATGLEPLSTGG